MLKIQEDSRGKFVFFLFKERVQHQSKLVLKCSTKCTDMTSWVHFPRGSIFLEQFPLRGYKVVLRALKEGVNKKN